MEESREEQSTTIELNEAEEGVNIESDNFYFQRIGGDILLKPEASNFDLENPPIQALAVSQDHQVIFLAHSEGFYVTKTRDAIEAAKLVKEKKNNCSIQELSILDVQIGRVRILSVSKDSSTLAACVGADISLFSIASLLSKEEEPLYSCSVEESSYVKDLRWRKKSKRSFVVLSSDGKLFHGDCNSPIKEVMCDVDAVDWSTGGNFIAVAKKNSLSIFSSRFRERFTLSIPVNPYNGDSESKCTIKVDSMNWVRQDCIVLGCIQITEDGREDGYLIQTVSSDGKISEASSKPVVLSFDGAFPGISDDILPSGCGPHLFLNYLDHRELAFVANKKSIDEHIILFGWSLDDEPKEAALILLAQEDRWLPRIGLQASWWERFGTEVPELMKFAVRVLNLTCSASGCERNWSTFESIHTKKRNKLEHQRLNALAYVKYNIGLRERSIRRRAKMDPILVDDIDSDDEWIAEKEDPIFPPTWINDEEDIFATTTIRNVGVDKDGEETQMPSQVPTQTTQVRSQVPTPKLTYKRKPTQGQGSNDGDDNVIMGFAVDKVSLDEKFEVTLGAEPKELSPFCILLCLTLDGKLLMFYVADVTENPDAPKTVSAISDEEEDSSATILLTCDSSKPSSRFEEHKVEGTAFCAKSLDISQAELERKGGADINYELEKNERNDYSRTPLQDDLSNREKTNSFSMSFHSAGTTQGILRPLTTNKEQKTLGDLPQSFERQQNANFGPQALISGRKGLNFEKSSENSPLFVEPDSTSNNPGKSEAPKAAFASSGGLKTNSFTGNIPSIIQSKYKDSLSCEVSKNSQKVGLQNASSGSDSSHKPSSSNELNSAVSSTEVNRVEYSGSRMGNTVKVTENQSSFDPCYSSTLNTKDSNAGSPFSVKTSAISTSVGGQRSLTGAGKLQPTQENFKSPKSYGMAAERELSKNFGNVNEMAKDLDTLLSCIEGEGGFRDACIMSQKSSVLEIEESLENLTKRCRVWKSKMEERLGGIQHLLDQTVQVLARKIYIESIVKQASDSLYWDLWNRQKLTPELDLKRRQILEVNQDLTNQLIELERHFNTLELNKFGENSAATRRVFHAGAKPSRDGPALHRLYNTMSSQLAAAEQLSECLTKQMAVLNIESPSAKRKFVAKELFESIGLDYDGDSFKSPNVKKIVHSPESIKKLPFSSASTALKEHSRRNPSSVVKSFESETARRRVSLDRSWASFEPPKTTVKRMLLQDERPRLTANKLSLVTNKKGSLQCSADAPLADKNNSSPSLHSHVNKDKTNRFQIQVAQDIQDKAPEQASSTSSFKWANDLSGKSQSTNMKSSAPQVTLRSKLISSSVMLDSTLLSSEIRDNTNASFALLSDRSTIGQGGVNISDDPKVQAMPLSNAISNLSSEDSVNQTSSATILVPSQTLASSNKTPLKMSASRLSNLNHGDSAQTKAASSSANYQGVPFTPSASPTASFPNMFSQLETVIETQSGVSAVLPPMSVSSSVASASTPIKASIPESPTPLSILPSSSFSTSLTKAETTTKPSRDAQVTSESFHSSSSYSTSSLASLSSFSLQGATQQFQPSISPTTTNVKSQAQPTVKTMFPPMEPKPAAGELNSKSEATPAEPAHAGVSIPSVAIDTKNGSSDLSVNQEDEMDEEASDTTTDLGMMNFGGFGLGSATPKPNPFGGTFQNTPANPPNPSFNFTVPTEELFRPASFNIQPIQPSQPASQSAFSSHFTAPEPTRSGFGQPSQIGPGQQALGSVLGAFGQSRQLGTSPPPGAGFGAASGFGTGALSANAPTGGFGINSGIGTPPATGFTNPATGGFAGVASTVGGFSGIGSRASGFAAAATSGAGGFGSFSNQQGGGGFSGFGSGSAGSGTPSSALFTQMRK